MKTIHSIIRTEKIKTFGQLSAKNNHNHRLSDVPNAAPKSDVKLLFGSDDIVSDVKSHLVKQGINPEKIRKNGVICNELICSLSPEYFLDNVLDYKGKFNKQNTNEFIRRVRAFLLETYGDNLVSLVVHLDESTPHIHAIVVPVYEDTSSGSFKLSAKRFFDRPQLTLLQKRYCAVFKQLKGFQVTYAEKSKAKHTDIKTFYSELNATKAAHQTQLDEKDTQIKRLRDERTALRREVTHYQVALSKVKKNIKKIESVMGGWPEQITEYIYKYITKILSYTTATYEDEITKPTEPHLNVNHDVESSSSELEKPKPILPPPSPFRRPRHLR